MLEDMPIMFSVVLSMRYLESMYKVLLICTNFLTSKPLYGFYYGRELARADLSDLEIEKIIKRKTSPDKRKLIYVKFKNLDESYNRWIEQPGDK